MNIREISRITGLSAHTLRYYEKIGLLLNIRRDLSGHRYYSERDLVWIEFIKRLKATSMPLSEIRDFARLRIEGDTTIPDRVAILKNHEARVERQLRELKNHQRNIKAKIELCRKGGKLV